MIRKRDDTNEDDAPPPTPRSSAKSRRATAVAKTNESSEANSAPSANGKSKRPTQRKAASTEHPEQGFEAPTQDRTPAWGAGQREAARTEFQRQRRAAAARKASQSEAPQLTNHRERENQILSRLDNLDVDATPDEAGGVDDVSHAPDTPNSFGPGPRQDRALQRDSTDDTHNAFSSAAPAAERPTHAPTEPTGTDTATDDADHQVPDADTADPVEDDAVEDDDDLGDQDGTPTVGGPVADTSDADDDITTDGIDAEVFIDSDATGEADRPTDGHDDSEWLISDGDVTFGGGSDHDPTPAGDDSGQLTIAQELALLANAPAEHRREAGRMLGDAEATTVTDDDTDDNPWRARSPQTVDNSNNLVIPGMESQAANGHATSAFVDFDEPRPSYDDYDYDDDDDAAPLKGGARWYRRQIRNYGWLVGLIPMAGFGLIAWALQFFSDNAVLARLSLGCGALAAPLMMVAGLPFGTQDDYRTAIIASIGVWLVLGWWASRRALSDPMPNWRTYSKQLFGLTAAMGVGIGIGYLVSYYYLGLIG